MLDRVDRTEEVAFVDRPHLAKYGGMNPEFYKRAQMKNRLAREALARQEEKLRIAEEKAKREREHMERLQQQADKRFRKMMENFGARPKEPGVAAMERSSEEPIAMTKQPVREIIAEISEKTGVPVREIVGGRRSKRIIEARHLAMKEAALRRPDMSLPQLGRQFGGRDHTTLLSALRKMGVDTSNKRHKASQ